MLKNDRKLKRVQKMQNKNYVFELVDDQIIFRASKAISSIP